MAQAVASGGVRLFVLSGWFGRVFSPGMGALAERLKSYGETTFHDWNDTMIITMIEKQKQKVAVIGFSLGANQLGWISHHIRRQIELGVAYDASKQSPLVEGNVQTAPHFNRLLCYYNPGAWIYGGARYVGNNVETSFINLPHLAVQFSEELHLKTIAAVKQL